MPDREAAARVTGVDLEERLARLPRTGDFGWLRDYADSVVPVLQTIRRRGPGAARRGALLALVYLRGEAGLDAEDLAVLRRLIRIKAARTCRTPSMPPMRIHAPSGILCFPPTGACARD